MGGPSLRMGNVRNDDNWVFEVLDKAKDACFSLNISSVYDQTSRRPGSDMDLHVFTAVPL